MAKAYQVKYFLLAWQPTNVCILQKLKNIYMRRKRPRKMLEVNNVPNSWSKSSLMGTILFVANPKKKIKNTTVVQ